MENWLKGKKTYLVAAATAVTGALAALGIPVPVWVWTLLGSLGLAFLRAGVDKAIDSVDVDKKF